MAKQTLQGSDTVGNTGLLKTNENFTDLYDNKLALSGGTMTGLLTLGTGDIWNMYNVAVTGQKIDARVGFFNTPDLGEGPVIKAHRTIGHTAAQRDALTGAPGSDAADELAALAGITRAPAGCDVQPVGVNGAAITAGTNPSTGADACGGYFTGRVLSGGVGVGIGAFIAGRRDDPNASVTGIEIHSSNYGGVGCVYDGAGWDDCHAMWVTCGGNADSGSVLLVGKPTGLRQFEVGIGFLGGTNNPIKGASFRDDGASEHGLLINGTKSVAAIEVAPGAGDVKIRSRLVFGDGSVQTSAPTGAGYVAQRSMTPTKSGTWIGASGGDSSAIAAMNNNMCYALPLFLPVALTFSHVGLNVTTAGVAAAGTPVIRLGIYDDNGTCYPGALVADIGTIDVTTTGAKQLVYTGTLQPGTYFLVAAPQNCPTTAPRSTGLNAGFPGVASAGIADPTGGYVNTSVSGALPATWPTTVANGPVGPRVLLRIA